MKTQRVYNLLESILHEVEGNGGSIFKSRNVEGWCEERLEQLKNQLKDVEVYRDELDLRWLPDSITSLSDIAPKLKTIDGFLDLSDRMLIFLKKQKGKIKGLEEVSVGTIRYF